MILNLTQHNATEDQINAGIVDLPAEFKTALVGADNKVQSYQDLVKEVDDELEAQGIVIESFELK